MTYSGQPQVPDGQDEQSDLGTAVLAAIWTYLSVTTVVLVLRFYAQIRIQRKTATDDYFMILAWVSQVIGNGFVTYAVYRGLGQHSYYLSLEDRIQVVKYEYIGGAWGIISPTLGRISYALFLLSVLWLLTTVRRIFLWVLIALQVVLNLLALIIIFVQCHPTSRVWNPSVPGYCVSVDVQGDIGFAQGAINTLSDLILTVIGMTVVLHLNVRKWTKVVLAVLMGLSSIAMAASIVRTIELQKLESTQDFTYETVPFVIWYTLETNVVMIAASVPKIRPLVMLLQRRYSSSRGSSERDSDFHGYYDEESARERLEAPGRRRRRSTLARLKFAWDPHATRLSGTRDSGYSSSDLRSPTYDNESALTSVSSMGSNQERHANPFTRWLRNPARRSPPNRERSNSITLAQLARRSPQKKKKSQRSYSMSSRSPGASPRAKHFRLTSGLSHSRTRSSNRNVFDRNSVVPALQNQNRGKTTISAGGPLPPSVPTSMSCTPRPESGGMSERTSINNDEHENEYIGPPLTGIRSVGPVCIWRTREYTIQYEDNDTDPESAHVGEPGPTYDEAEANGLELHDIGGFLGESSQQGNAVSNKSESCHDADLCSPLSTVEEVPTETSELHGPKDILREGNDGHNNQSTYDEAAAGRLQLSDVGGILSSSSENATGTNTGTNSAGNTSPRHKANNTSPQETYDPSVADRLELSDAGGILKRSNETNNRAGITHGNSSNSRPSAASSTHQATYDPDVADRLELSDIGGILNGYNNDST
ncbi:integral membrane protein [Paecilomyces variotii No. 5]|uniref:Integral membrane protein n=1 Tax=Byssochlamys spectabilis (strain No. 5 / NBRC 109023) TaxID=1356009 RepID=V5FN20_BYSSN|nr:integral membrane protein [Paecilomyces variotii No. 5]